MPRSSPVLALAAALLATIATACATQATQAKPTIEQRLASRGLAIGDAVERIPDYRIDGWNRVDDQRVVLNAGASRRYLITLAQPCSDLGTGETIGFSTTASALTALDTLIVETPIGPRRCPISDIHVLEKVDPSGE